METSNVGVQERSGHDAMLEEYIEEANAICKKWQLATEFEVYHIEEEPAKLQTSATGRQNVVAIRKKLGDRRYSVENWRPAEFERQLRFLRDIAESLEISSAPANLDADAVGEGYVPDAIEADQGKEVAKVSAERSPDSATPEATTECHEMMLPSDDSSSPSMSSLRLLGLGRIHYGMSIVNNGEAGNDSPLPVAIHSITGVTVGVLEAQVTREEIPIPKTRRASQTLSWRSPKSPPAPGSDFKTHRVRIRLDKLRLTGLHDTHTDRMWILLKQRSSDANDSVLASKRVIRTSTAEGRVMTYDVSQVVDLQLHGTTVMVEIWCCNLPMTPRDLQVADVPANTPMKLDFYVSVDIDERDSDGLYHPVPIKPDGSLRLVSGRLRRVNVRITQSDLLPFALERVVYASLCSPLRIRDTETVGREDQLEVTGATKSIQRLVTSQESAISLLRFVTSSQAHAPMHALSSDGDDITDDETQAVVPMQSAWQSLELRSESTADASSRSVSAVLKWDHSVSKQTQETPDSDGMRTLYRVVVAFVTHWSRTPVVVSKTIAVKMSPAATSAVKRLARDREASQTMWWARECFSRNFRVGTWYSADITADAGSSAKEGLEQPTSSPEDQQLEMHVSAAVTHHITGVHRMELGAELDRVRQMLWASLQNAQRFGAQSSETRGDIAPVDTEAGLTVDQVNQQLATINAVSRDSVLHVECIERPSCEHGGDFFLRFKHWHELAMDLIDGRMADERGIREDSQDESPPNLNASGHAHTVFYTHTPAGLDICDEVDTEMAGFLMLSTSQSPDDAAAALISPLPSKKQPTSRNSITTIATGKDAPMAWQRQWFVLRRPFLYSYDTYECKILTGVIDISACQLVAPSTLPYTSKRMLDSSLGSSSSGGRSWAVENVNPSLPVNQLPFTFRLVNMASNDSKKKCVMWTLQASTAAEMRSWLAVIQPFKTERRAPFASIGVVAPALTMVTRTPSQEEGRVVEH